MLRQAAIGPCAPATFQQPAQLRLEPPGGGPQAVFADPALVVAVTLLAWRWEWIGAVLYAAAGLLYIVIIWPRPLPPATKVTWSLTIAGPSFVIAALFLANWLKRGELRVTR